MTEGLLKVAVIGFGRMGRIYARTVVEDVDSTLLHAVVDSDRGCREEAAAKFSVPYVLENPADLWELPGLDAVIIATPTRTHKRLVTTAAREGKAIFCEKPLALSREGVSEALSVVQDAGVPLQVGFMRRFDNAYQRAYRSIQSGRIGEPVVFKSLGRDPRCPDPEFADPSRSGGLILDMGIHDFDLARWMMQSEVAKVSADGSLLVCDELESVGDIDNAVINLRFENGALGNVEVSRNASYGYDVRTEILGSSGAVRVGQEVSRGSDGVVRTGDGVSTEDYLTERFGEAYRTQIGHFAECVLENGEPLVSGRDARAAFEIGLAATYSARIDSAVSVGEVRNGWAPEGAALQ